MTRRRDCGVYCYCSHVALLSLPRATRAATSCAVVVIVAAAFSSATNCAILLPYWRVCNLFRCFFSWKEKLRNIEWMKPNSNFNSQGNFTRFLVSKKIYILYTINYIQFEAYFLFLPRYLENHLTNAF